MKIILIMAAVIVLMNMSNVLAAETRFPDTVGHWAEEYIETLAEKGIVSGMEDGLFHPDEMVTTAQFVTMIMQNSSETIPASNGHWASGYLDEAFRLGLIENNDIEDRDLYIMRRSAARIGLEALRNLFGEADAPDIKAAEERLIDLYLCNTCVWSTGQFYVKGIMVGRPDGMFYGDDALTRAEAAVVIMKIIDPSLRTPQEAIFPEASENGLISADEAIQLMKTYRSAVLIDVRSQEEHRAGFIQGSICIPLPDILSNITQTQMPEDTGAVIILYCQKGSRSEKAYAALKEAGYKNVYKISGIDDWPYDIYTTD